MRGGGAREITKSAKSAWFSPLRTAPASFGHFFSKWGCQRLIVRARGSVGAYRHGRDQQYPRVPWLSP